MVVSWRELVEVENECTLHNFSLFPIFLQKIIKIGVNLMKFWQKQFCPVFWNMVYFSKRGHLYAWDCIMTAAATQRVAVLVMMHSTHLQAYSRWPCSATSYPVRSVVNNIIKQTPLQLRFISYNPLIQYSYSLCSYAVTGRPVNSSYEHQLLSLYIHSSPVACSLLLAVNRGRLPDVFVLSPLSRQLDSPTLIASGPISPVTTDCWGCSMVGTAVISLFTQLFTLHYCLPHAVCHWLNVHITPNRMASRINFYSELISDIANLELAISLIRN